MRGSSSFGLLFLVALTGGAGACASAPPVKASVLTREQKLAQIVRLEDQRILREAPPPAPAQPAGRRARRAPPPPPPPDLVPLLADPEVEIRRRAALAVGRVGLVEGAQPLVPLLKDPDPDVRQMAAFALGLIGDRSASAPLQETLSDSSLVVRGRAAEAIGLIGDPSAAGAIAAMAKDAAAQGNVAGLEPDAERFPMDPAVEAFRLGIYALVRLKAYEPLATAVLDGTGQPIARWWPIAFALARIEDARAGRGLRALVSGPGRYTQAFAARGLGVLKVAEAREALVALVDPARLDPLVAVSAVRALGQIGGDQAADALLGLLAAPEVAPNVRLEAVTALGALHTAAAADVLMDLAGDPWPAMRAEALQALALVDPDAFTFALSGLDPDPHWSVRAALARALAALPPQVAGPRLLTMLEDTDRRVIPTVLSALVRVKSPEAEAVLRGHLEDADVVIRTTAVRELGEMKPADGPRLFSEAYERWSADPTYLARAAALTAASRYGAGAAETLTAALRDREWAVRVRALDLLKEIGSPGDPHAIRPATQWVSSLDSLDATNVVAPQFSPQLYIETTKGLIQIELAVREAPLTTQALMTLARKGFFTGIAFHRVVPNFVVQGGDPRGDGEGGPNFTLRDENSELPYLRGTVGLALDWRDTGGSQFFITHSPQPHLDGRYPIIGRVVKGMEVVDALQRWDVIERVRVWDGMTLSRTADDR
ncbi:MAG TPA: HEAT repeat domain-containing protein [Vicinamibacterales bacterium]|nr:HEAT repeat domain-containing protein [Vicinamibacterales bacterium]